LNFPGINRSLEKTVGASGAAAEEAVPLLPDVAAGDRLAINRCIRRYGPLIWAIARRLSPTQSDAEDAVQEIFLDVWRHAARFDAAKGSEKVFITVLARRRLIDRLRAGRARLAAEVPIDEGMDLESAAGSHAERDAEIQEARNVLRALPAEQQQVITLSLVHGMSHGEIAGRVGLPLGTVKTLIRRGVLRVRSMLSLARHNPISEKGLR
jgi:RNA polymerase sigma-70 factor (ECF subfamily)